VRWVVILVAFSVVALAVWFVDQRVRAVPREG
jgi:hypothetical protein